MLDFSMMMHHRITIEECITFCIEDSLKNECDGPVAWLPRMASLDLCLIFFWSLLKDIVFVRALTTKNDMKK